MKVQLLSRENFGDMNINKVINCHGFLAADKLFEI